MLDKKFVNHYAGLHQLAKDIIHGKTAQINGSDLDKLYSELLGLRNKLKKERKIHKIDEVDTWEDLK